MNKEIHLKHGKLHHHHHHHHDEKKENGGGGGGGGEDDDDDDSDHVIFRYKWLEDDIIKSEKEFEGVEDDEYPDTGKKVKLPGGCELTEDQYYELESFKKETNYVKKW